VLDQYSGADLVKRFGGYWKAWAAPGRALAEANGHSLGPLAAGILSELRNAADASIQKRIDQLAADGVLDAPKVIDIFSGRQ